jgi:hypothetical protein
MRNTDITHGVRKTVLKYRSGTPFNRKRACWFKRADNSNCLLCGQEDGCDHTASGCPVLGRLYTHRHNTIGRIILKAITRGRKGGYVVMIDLGSDSHCTADGLVPLSGCTESPMMTRGGLTSQHAGAHSRSGAKADHTRCFNLQACHSRPHCRVFGDVELKFCRDTDREGKLAQAVEQHKGLCKAQTLPPPSITFL